MNKSKPLPFLLQPCEWMLREIVNTRHSILDLAQPCKILRWVWLTRCQHGVGFPAVFVTNPDFSHSFRSQRQFLVTAPGPQTLGSIWAARLLDRTLFF